MLQWDCDAQLFARSIFFSAVSTVTIICVVMAVMMVESSEPLFYSSGRGGQGKGQSGGDDDEGTDFGSM